MSLVQKNRRIETTNRIIVRTPSTSYLKTTRFIYTLRLSNIFSFTNLVTLILSIQYYRFVKDESSKQKIKRNWEDLFRTLNKY